MWIRKFVSLKKIRKKKLKKQNVMEKQKMVWSRKKIKKKEK